MFYSDIRQTQIQLLRKDSLGLTGTLRNAEHHATRLLPFIHNLFDKMHLLGFKLWRQGNNVHEFVTFDGRKFTLRGIVLNDEYIGIQLAARVSRSQEIPLFGITDLRQIPELLEIMCRLSIDTIGDTLQVGSLT